MPKPTLVSTPATPVSLKGSTFVNWTSSASNHHTHKVPTRDRASPTSVPTSVRICASEPSVAATCRLTAGADLTPLGTTFRVSAMFVTIDARVVAMSKEEALPAVAASKLDCAVISCF